jgi:hypothetical protein
MTFLTVTIQTKEERSFGFVTFASIEEADAALAVKTHKIGDRDVEVKRAIANTRAPVSILSSLLKRTFSLLHFCSQCLVPQWLPLCRGYSTHHLFSR